MPSVIADDERHLGVDRFEDRIGGGRRRNVDDARVAAGHRPRFADGLEHRQAEVRLAALPGAVPPTMRVP